MLAPPKYECDFDRTDRQVRRAIAPSPTLIHDVLSSACTRIPVLERAGKANNIERLIAAGAWCDAVYALIELEIPGWCIRRLVHEDGEWLCSLTREPNLPAGLDDTAEASHESLPLAVLCAFLEVQRKSALLRDTCASTVPQIRSAAGRAICCDNFS
jgi:hypothetical protein